MPAANYLGEERDGRAVFSCCAEAVRRPGRETVRLLDVEDCCQTDDLQHLVSPLPHVFKYQLATHVSESRVQVDKLTHSSGGQEIIPREVQDQRMLTGFAR
jgi:hypothetical protein